MSKDLFTQPAVIEPHAVPVDIPSVDQLPAIADPRGDQQPKALREFRENFMMVPLAVAERGLAEYDEIRDYFRRWLLAKLVRGVHYGFAPGCEPKWCDASGNELPRDRATHTKSYSNGKWYVTSMLQWMPKEGLYKAGAQTICDVLWSRPEFEADMDTWRQLGEPKGVIVLRCRIISKITDRELGQGGGIRREGQKGGDANNALKMAEKSAQCNAVINAYGLSDLFAQDTEEGDTQPPHDNPAANPVAPKQQPRGSRVTSQQIKALSARWKKAQEPGKDNVERWKLFVKNATGGKEFDCLLPSAWTENDLAMVDYSLKEKHDA